MLITYLADNPALAAPLIPDLLDHWRSVLPHDTAQNRAERFVAHHNRDVLPIAWVAHQDQQVFGTAALRLTDLPGREDLGPWLGGVFVRRQFRRRGIASALCGVVEDKARSLGFDRLYLFTIDQQSLYQHLGWLPLYPAEWQGHRAEIMVKPLSLQQTFPPPSSP